MLVKDADMTLPSITYLNNKVWYISIKDLVPDYIKRKFGRRELIYNQDEIKDIMTTVLLENEYKYDKLWEMLQMEWNPLWNVDGTETLIYDKTGSGSNEASGKDKTETTNDVTNTGSERTYDSATLFDNAKEVIDGDGSSTTTYGRKDEQTAEEHYTETKVRHGNIGVTKTTELIDDALDIYADKRMSFLYTISHDLIVELAYMC